MRSARSWIKSISNLMLASSRVFHLNFHGECHEEGKYSCSCTCTPPTNSNAIIAPACISWGLLVKSSLTCPWLEEVLVVVTDTFSNRKAMDGPQSPKRNS